MADKACKEHEIDSNVRKQIFGYFEWLSNEKYKYPLEGVMHWFNDEDTFASWYNDFLDTDQLSDQCNCEECLRIVEKYIKKNTALSVEEVQAVVEFHKAHVEAEDIAYGTYVVKDMLCYKDIEANPEKGFEFLHQAAKKAFAVFEKRGRTIYTGPSFFE